MVNSLLSAAEIHQVLREVLNGTNILAGQNWSISVLKSLCCNNLKPPEKLNSSWSLVRRAVQLDGGGAIGNLFEVLLNWWLGIDITPLGPLWLTYYF